MRRLGTALSALSALALLLVPTACGDGGSSQDAAYDPAEDTSTYDSPRSDDVFNDDKDYEQTLELADGRTVRMFYSGSGDRLMEQHRAAGGGRWTAPQVVAEPGDDDPCQGIELVEDDGRVAVIADFGGYCYDGEPPMSSIAAVGLGDLTDWQVHVTPEIDGWTKVVPADDGFRWTGSGLELTWSADDGFSDPRPTD